MKITIITACHNGEAFIRTALESVLTQTWPDVEYLVVDGGSADGTAGIIREYEPKFQGRMTWWSEPSSGLYDAINKGIRMATGEAVGILNADDVLSDDRVIERVAMAFGGSSLVHHCNSALVGGHEEVKRSSKVRECASAKVGGNGAVGKPRSAGSDILPISQPAIPLSLHSHFQTNELLPDVVYGDIRFVASRECAGLEDVRSEQTLRYYSARHWRPWMLQWGFMPPHPSVYIRRECFDRLGDYELDYQIAADYELLIRFLRKAPLRSRYVPMCFVDMRVGGVSTKNWRSNLLLNREIVRGNREAGYFCCLPMLVPKYAFKIWEFAMPRLRYVFSRKNAKTQRG